MRAIIGLRRWRHNALCRPTDRAEAWLALAALLLLLLAAPLAGAVVGSAADDALRRSVREQREARHTVTASVIRELPRPPVDPDAEGPAGHAGLSRVLARWTAPDGTPHRDTVMTSLRDPRPGGRFSLWTDEQGRVVARPMDGATATTHAVLAGFGAAVGAAGLIEGGRRLILRRMVRRRYARIDRAWARTGPDWGRTGTGS